MWHDGRHHMGDRQALRQWQWAYRQRVRRDGPDDTGVFDGATQKAVIYLQKLTGQPVDGQIGPDTWAAVFTYQRPPRVKRDQPPPPSGPNVIRHSKRSWHYWRTFSSHGTSYATTPGAPPWYPGRPFGLHESGWHVREVQAHLGVKETGFFNHCTLRRVRGLQRLHRLPVSGIVDETTACLIDPGPWPELEESSEREGSQPGL